MTWRNSLTSLTIVAGLICTIPSPPAADAQQNLEDQLRAFTPARVIADSEQFPEPSGAPSPIDVIFKRADLDGTGQFNFIVVVYNTGLEAALRVLRVVNGQLQVAADLPENFDDISGARIQLKLNDVDNDGLPEIALSTYGVRLDFRLYVFKWTGTGLRSLIPQKSIGDGELYDIDGEGLLEIISPPPYTIDPDDPNDAVKLNGPYKVYKFDGNVYKLAFTSPKDPTNRLDVSGNPQFVFARRAVMDPDRFPLVDIRQPGGCQAGDGVVTLRLGNLTAGERAGLVDVTQIEAQSLTLNRNLHPLVSIILPASPEGGEEAHKVGGNPASGQEALLTRFQGAVLQAQFGRSAFLQFLPRAQTDLPLAPGQKVSLNINGRMKSGVPLSGVATVTIEGESK